MRLFIGKQDGTLVVVLEDLEQYDLENPIARASLADEVLTTINGDPDLKREYKEAN